MECEKMKENLHAAGCAEVVTEDIIRMYGDGNGRDALLEIKRNRCRLMEELHESARKVDCLDYLIRKVEKELSEES